MRGVAIGGLEIDGVGLRMAAYRRRPGALLLAVVQRRRDRAGLPTAVTATPSY